jgi:hypothetical protein
MLMLLCASAHAGVYTVSGCRTGWVPDVRNTSGGAATAAYDLCDHSVRSLSAGLPWNTTPRANAGDYGGWRFDAPANTVIDGLSLTWNGRGDYTGSDAGSDWGAANVSIDASNNAQLAWHIDPFSANDRFAMQDASWVRFVVRCQAQAGSTCRTSLVDPATGLMSLGWQRSTRA